MRFLLLINILFLIFLSSCRESVTTITNPPGTQIVLRSKIPVPNGFVYSIFAKNVNGINFIFMAADNAGLVSVNINDPDNPIIASSYSTGGFSNDIYVSNINGADYALISDGSKGISLLDVSNPYMVTIDTSIAFLNDNVSTVHIDSLNKLGLIGTDNGYLYIYDLANLPNRISLISSYYAVNSINSIALRNDMCYLAVGTSGVEILDIYPPSSPLFIGGFNTAGFVNDIEIYSQTLYAADGNEGLTILDVSNPFNPQFLKTITTKSHTYAVHLSNNFLFTAEPQFGFEMFSIADPKNPYLFNSINTAEITANISFFNNYIYTANGSGGLSIYKYGN